MPRSANAASDPDNGSTGRSSRWLALETRDPTPLADAESFWRSCAQAATILMAVLALGVFLFFAAKLVVPVLAAIAVGMTFGPVVGYASARGIPSWVMAILVLVLLIALANGAVIALAQPIAELFGRAPELGGAIKDKLQFMDRPMAAFNELRQTLGLGLGSLSDEGVSNSRVLEGVVTVVTPAAVQFAMQLVLFFGTLFFFIIGRAEFRKFALNWCATREARLRALKIFNDIEDNLGGYLFVVTLINLSLGVVTVAMAYALGLPAPILWGALAFALNYLPYVGAGIMHVLLFVIGLLTFPTFLGALLPPAVFILITTIEGQFLTPAIVGRRVLSIHPLSIFLGIAFWAWMWGPMGAFLATPILIAGRVIYDHVYPRQKTELPG